MPSKLSAAPSKSSPRRVTRNIEDVRLGDWVLAKNPELAAEDRPPELDHPRPENLRALSLRLQKEDDSWLDLQLLRSPDWLEEHQQGNTVYVDLEELGAKGWAELLAVEPCPAIGPRPHPDCRLITGRFIHQSADTFDLAITDAEGQPLTNIGLTDNHPIWSVDRQQFVPAGSLTIGEQMTDTQGETLKVGSLTPRAGPEPVYNLEVDVEHVYFVSDAGLLVHNVYPGGPVAGGGADLSRALRNMTPGEIRRIQNAANRIGRPIHVVGSRSGGSKLPRPESDWDFVIEGGGRVPRRISSSLPGAKSVQQGTPWNQDMFKGPLKRELPHITFFPE